MSRSQYTDDGDQWQLIKYRGQVASTIRGKVGQAFLRELVEALDVMPVKELIADELVGPDGACCAIGAVCLARGLDTSTVDKNEPEQVGNLVGISHQLAAEIEYINDDDYRHSTNAKRWAVMRDWASSKIVVKA